MADQEEIVFYENEIEMYLDEFCQQCKPPIEDMSKEPQGKWNAALMYINKYVFKGTNKLKLNKPYDNYNNIYNSNLNNSNCNAYDINAVNRLCDIYIYLCGAYDKEISIMGFSKLSGIDWNSINVWSHEEPSSPRFGIYQKLCKEREESLSSKLIAGAKNPVGVIAVLNRQFGWASPYTADSNRQKQALTADQLPQLGEANSQNIKALTSNNMVDNAK